MTAEHPVTLTEEQRNVFWEHVDPCNSDASGAVLIEYVERLLTEQQEQIAQAIEALHETGLYDGYTVRCMADIARSGGGDQ